MKIASEKVWATKDGTLVPDGDPDALVLVASKGHPISEKMLAKFNPGDVKKFFEPPNFDDDGKHKGSMTMEVTAPRKFSRVDQPEGGPQPENRESDMPSRKTREAAPAAPVKGKKKAGKK